MSAARKPAARKRAARKPVAAATAKPAADDFFGAPVRRIRAAAALVAAKPQWDVLMIARRSDGIDMAAFAADLPLPIRSIRFVREPSEVDVLDRTFDLCVLCNRVVDEELVLKQVRDRQLAPLIVNWAWDNHHSRKRNLQIAQLADLILPAHHYCGRYLLSPHTILGSHVPLGSYQWSPATAAALFTRHRDRPRDNAIHGSFMSWRILPGRAELVRELSQNLRGHALRLLQGSDRMGYFGRSAENRWLDWAAHKAGLILPLGKDLSTRFFDSLLTGQVPIVPLWCPDFESVIGSERARSLPVVRLTEPTVAAVEAAWREAVERYDVDGVAGAERRHRFALEHHHVLRRLAPICQEVRALAAPDARIEMATGMGAVGPVLRHD